MFQWVVARRSLPAERKILGAALTRHLDHYRNDPGAATQLLSVGESPRDEKLNPVELAAYAATANLILNLDEAITKK
jgi:hypothetical protein